jgi:hypothetical protein
MYKRYNKFGNKKCVYKNLHFDSIGEKNRFVELEKLQSRKEISKLRTQVTYELQKKFTDQHGIKHRAITYRADFVYIDSEGCTVVEDYKSKATAKEPLYRLKMKMMVLKLLKMQESEGVEYRFLEYIK